jgi:uncharacterized protein
MNVHEELLGYIDELVIIDTHEHLPMEDDRPQDTDVLSEWLMHYFSCDLISAGLSEDDLATARDAKQPLRKRWKLVEPYWEAARYTGYGRVLDIAAKGIYGINGVNAKTLPALDEAFKAARAKGGHYKYVLKERSRIALGLVTRNMDADRRFFASVFQVYPFLRPSHRVEVQRLGKEAGVRIHSLDDWKQAVEIILDKALADYAVALKVGDAYLRPLHYEKATQEQAERDFRQLYLEDHSPAWRAGIKMGRAFEDHMMHHVLALADRRGLVVQFHTGIQEGNGNLISDSNPVLLTNLLLEYENVKFDLFHMGYPYCMELSNLAKNFRNVFIDMCWGHIISPEAARRALVEWLDAVPANKISAFGGDYSFVDGVYGHNVLARQNVAAALAQKVGDGSFDLDRAKQIARMVFVDNPMKLFDLSERVRDAK